MDFCKPYSNVNEFHLFLYKKYYTGWSVTTKTGISEPFACFAIKFKADWIMRL